jgi:alpha-tubulin suppressor-like RCC1 family protein
VAGVFDAIGLSAGELDTACAVRANGNVVCWGLNAAGEVGVEPPTREHSPVTVPTLADATAVAVGREHSCALLSEGRVACWGANEFGQLGGGQVDQDPHPSPVTATGLMSATAISAGGDSACALLADASVVCWGAGGFGQVGDGSMAVAVGTPTSVMGLTNAIAITLGARHGCAVRGDGTVWCWGANDAGQIGDGTAMNALTPVQVAGLTNIVAIASGGLHTCARDSNGGVWCWGSVNENQLPSVGTSGDNLIPVTKISELVGTGAMGPSLQHDCFVANDASVRCGGRDDSGELGDGSVQPSAALTTVCW